MKTIDYCDVLIAKKPSLTKTQKKIIEDIQRVCKERRLKVMVVDSELTIKNKRVIWKAVGA